MLRSGLYTILGFCAGWALAEWLYKQPPVQLPAPAPRWQRL